MDFLDSSKQKRTQAYVDEAYKLIEEKPGVEDIIVLNQFGNPIKTTMESKRAIEYAGLYESLKEKVQLTLQKLDPTDELHMLRVRSNFDEVLVTPDGKVTFLVVQKAVDKVHV